VPCVAPPKNVLLPLTVTVCPLAAVGDVFPKPLQNPRRRRNSVGVGGDAQREGGPSGKVRVFVAPIGLAAAPVNTTGRMYNGCALAKFKVTVMFAWALGQFAP
jgi:hypothetical protein